jgi:hypothetical protein
MVARSTLTAMRRGSSWIRRSPHKGFSRFIVTMSSTILASVGGRPPACRRFQKLRKRLTHRLMVRRWAER